VSMNDLTIGIVTYNSTETIGKALQSLCDHWPSSLSCHVYVIDNGSSEPADYSRWASDDRFTFLSSEQGNVGFGAAHNSILPRLDAPYHIMMNPDILIEDDRSLPELIQYMNGHPDVGMAVPRIVDEKGIQQYLCRRDITFVDLVLRYIPGRFFLTRQRWHTMQDCDYHHSFEVPFASGCFMLVRTSVFQKLQGFDPRFFLYAEDADLTRRINQISRTVYVPAATVCHLWQRASYKSLRMMMIHVTSVWRYFRKWGFRFK